MVKFSPFSLSVVVSICVLLSGCTSMFYYPSQIEYVQKNDLPYTIEELNFPSSSGGNVNAWYFHSKNPKAKVLFYHGNAQNLSAHFAMLSWLADNNYDMMIFDFPGYGKSTGKPTPESTVLSGADALKKIDSIKPELPLFVYGQSLGGQIMLKSLNLYEKKNYKAVFIEASFLSYRSVAKRMMAKSWITWLAQPIAWLLMSDKWAGDPALIAPIPIYVLHGSLDNIVPVDQSEQVFERAKNPKQWKVIDGGGHTNSYYVKNGIHRNYLLSILDHELAQ